jgi:hypothetical protein
MSRRKPNKRRRADAPPKANPQAASQPTERQPDKAREFETQDAPPRAVAYLGLGPFVAVLVSGASVAGLLTLIGREHVTAGATAIERQAIAPPEPRLEIARAETRAKVEASGQGQLQGYAWVDKAAGRARIPIEAAMRIVAQQGWRDPPEAPRP